MTKEELSIPGLFKIHFYKAKDERGTFVKTFHQNNWKNLGLDFEVRENFYSISHKNVIRGMHFQTPPHEHHKFVFALGGEVTDVVLDLRKDSPTYGQFECIQLKENCGFGIFIPKGLAHGFLSITNLSVLYYLTTKEYTPENDLGIRFDSFGFDWNVDNPVISPRDLSFPSLRDFESPF